MDTISNRGMRKVAIGLETPSGKQLFKGFDFNGNAPLNSVLFAPYELKDANGRITITDFIPAEHLLFPEGATPWILLLRIQNWLLVLLPIFRLILTSNPLAYFLLLCLLLRELHFSC